MKGKQVNPPSTHPATHTQSSSATLSVQPPASFASTADQPACLFSTRWRLTGTLCRLKQQQKERGATAVLLVVQKMSASTFLRKTRTSNTSSDATWQRNTQRGVGELWKWKSCWWKSGPRAQKKGFRKQDFFVSVNGSYFYLLNKHIITELLLSRLIFWQQLPQRLGGDLPPGQKTSLSLLLFEFFFLPSFSVNVAFTWWI